ncbi:hypothetical protein MRX96_003605 [Rhipicephalus microplus]
MGTSGGGSVPYRPREPNPRIPRKESKTPASHMHLPPFLAAVSSKPPPTKSPSPNTATRAAVPIRTSFVPVDIVLCTATFGRKQFSRLATGIVN